MPTCAAAGYSRFLTATAADHTPGLRQPAAATAVAGASDVLLGRAAWRVFAGQLGILPVIAVLWQALTAMAVGRRGGRRRAQRVGGPVGARHDSPF